MARTGTRGPNTALRIPEPLLARIDAYARQLEASLPGSEVTRSEAIRVLLTKALDAAKTRAEALASLPDHPTPLMTAPRPTPRCCDACAHAMCPNVGQEMTVAACDQYVPATAAKGVP